MFTSKISPENFKPLPKDYQNLLLTFQAYINQGERDVLDYERRHFNGIREKAVIYCLKHAVDLGKGCQTIASARLPDSLTTLSRALLETIFWARYVTISADNAKEFVEIPIYELKRFAKKNLKSGYARILENVTNIDKTKEYLEFLECDRIPKRKSFEEIANAGGLGRLYTTLYGFLSMTAHGKAYNIFNKPVTDDDLYAPLTVAFGLLECIDLITMTWIVHREEVSLEILKQLIGIQ